MRLTRTFAALASATLIAGLAACADDDTATEETPAATATENTATEDDGPADATTDDDPGANDDEAPATAEPPVGGPAATVIFDGQDISGEFAQGFCEFGEDDGVPDVEYEADRVDDPENELQVEIDLLDPPRLDQLEIDTADGAEWETGDAEEAAATVTVEGEAYQVLTEVVEDDGPRRAQVDVTFMCN